MIKKNYKLIVGIIIGVIISVGTSYIVAATVINSRDVSYTDNAKLGVTNVQAAIDGTCSKIDTNINSLQTKINSKQDLISVKSKRITSFNIKGEGVIEVYKYGDVKFVYCNITNTSISSQWTQIVNLGTDYKTSSSTTALFQMPMPINRVALGMASVDNSGVLRVYSNENTTALLFSFSYI